MTLLPFTKRTYTSRSSADHLLQQLSRSIELSKAFRTPFFGNYRDTAFRGNIRGNRFDIRRVIHYRNSFNPDIEGVIANTENGSVITVTMQPSIPVLAFLILYTFLLCLATGTLIVSQIMKGQFDAGSLFILIFWALFLCLVNFGFYSEVENIDRYFIALCKADH